MLAGNDISIQSLIAAASRRKLMRVFEGGSKQDVSNE